MVFLPLFLILGNLVAFAQGELSNGREAPDAVEIVVEAADVTLELELVPSRGLAQIAGEVRPRLMFDHAATSWGIGLMPSPELAKAAEEVRPRIVVDHAAISSSTILSKSEELTQVAKQVIPRVEVTGAAISVFWQDLQGIPELSEIAYVVSPRIRIDHAEMSTLEAPSAPQFHLIPRPPETRPHPPGPLPPLFLWVAIGLIVGVLVGFFIWRLAG